MFVPILRLLDRRFRHLAIDCAATTATTASGFRLKRPIQIEQGAQHDECNDDNFHSLHDFSLSASLDLATPIPCYTNHMPTW